MEKLQEIANEIKTVDEFEDFCRKYIPSKWQIILILMPSITENLSYEIDIKNDLKEWERFITILIHFGIFQHSTVLEKLAYHYPKYPAECLFEAIEYYSGKRFYSDAVWYEPMAHVYKKYTHQIDKSRFDKYLFMVNKFDNYFISLLVQNNLDIPSNSIYADMEALLETRRCYSKPCLTIQEAKSKDIDMFQIFNGDGTLSNMKEIFEKTVFEDENYKEIQKNITIFNVGYDGEYTFDEFLICKWGVVKYISYLNQYGTMSEKDRHLYREFIISLIPKALDHHNLKALANIKELIQIFDNSIPNKILTNALVNHSLWKKEKEFQNIFEEMQVSAIKCFDEFTDKAPYTGDIGRAYITFQYKKGFSIWLLLNGYARYENFDKKIVLYESVLDVFEYAHVKRSENALKCASNILKKHKIAHSLMVWMD